MTGLRRPVCTINIHKSLLKAISLAAPMVTPSGVARHAPHGSPDQHHGHHQAARNTSPAGGGGQEEVEAPRCMAWLEIYMHVRYYLVMLYNIY